MTAKTIDTLIVGAGDAGRVVAKELLNTDLLPFRPVAFVDDDVAKQGVEYKGIPVVGTTYDIPKLAEKLSIGEIFICMPSVDKDVVNRVYEICRQTTCDIKILPGLYQIINGEGLAGLVRDVEIDDLLGRTPKKIIDKKVSNYYRDKVVMITGGGGSIGSELCRQVAKMKPKQIIVLDVYENGAYDIQQELRCQYGDALDVQIEIVSICDRAALERVFALWQPNIVIMAAAHKHVPLMEHNVIEAVKNNVFGTLNTVELAEKYKADRVHLVSTDKAVNPTSIMGATKRICEMIVQSHAMTAQHTTFSATRFGNVLGSAGSVIPLFKKQIAKGGPVTVTDFRIIRYFMTIPEASQLVLKSASMAKNGELFVLDMGEPVEIKTLAENLIRLSGYTPYEDIKIVETGLRPGEKLYEELLIKTEELDKTEDSLIFIEKDAPLSAAELQMKLENLKFGVRSGNETTMRTIVIEEVPTFMTTPTAAPAPKKSFCGKKKEKVAT